MLRLPPFSVNTRIVIPFLLAIIVVAGIGVFTVTRLVAGSVQERLNNQLIDSAKAASATIVEIERQYLAVLRVMVFTDGVAEAVETGDINALDTWLRPIAANARIDEFMIFNTTGQSILRLTRVTETQYEVLESDDLRDWAGIQQVLIGEVDDQGDKYLDIIEADNQTTIYISAPIRDDVDQLVGGIAVGIRGSTLVNQVYAQALSSVALLTPNLMIGSSFRGSPRFTPDDPEILGEIASENTPVRTVEVEGGNYAVLYSNLQLRGHNKGLLVVGLSSSFITDQGSSSRNLVGLLFLALFVIIMVMGLIVARTITNPISQLVNVTRSIREGNLGIRVGLRSRDELGELGKSFDKMTDQLVNRNRQIQTLYRQQLQETAQREAVLTSINDAVIVQDLNGERVLYNPTAEFLMATTAQDEQQREQLAHLLHNPTLLSHAQIVTFAERYFSVLATPVTTRQGVLIGYVIVFHDITDLIESERLKDELMQQLSHELRTPLSAVRGYVELIKLIDGANLSDQTSGFVDHAVDGIETLERMINQSIAVSQIISNRFRVEIDSFDFSLLLNDLVQYWKPKAEARALLFNAALPRGAIWLQGDERLLREVFDQVLLNACSYTLPDGQIQMEARIDADCLYLVISDTGVGIEQDELEQVFDRLYRGRSADAGPTDARGLGLGLYLARYVVQAHHGNITLTSQPNVGTVIQIELPLRQPGLKPNALMAAP